MSVKSRHSKTSQSKTDNANSSNSETYTNSHKKEPISQDLSESDDDEDEDEDEDGDSLTEKIDHGISDVLKASRSNDTHLMDKTYKFFPEIGAEGTAEAEMPIKKEKPMYLKDYQREQLLSQADGSRNVREENQKTYNEEQETLKNDSIKQFHDDGGDEEDDDVLSTKREGPSREIPDLKLPDPDNDADGFLDAFINQKGWIPKSKPEKNVPTYTQVVEEEDDSDEFDDLSEKFESAYNFRFEDPAAAEIVSYARDQNTLRRGKSSSRQKKREKEREVRNKELEKEKLEKSKLKKSKVNEITNKLAQLQEALGEGDERVAELLAKEDLEGDWDNDEWDRRMQKSFDEEFYEKDSKDNIAPGEDIGEAIPESNGEDEPSYDSHSENHDDTKLDIRQGSRLNRKELKRKAEQFVESNQDLIDEAFLPTKSNFRYREVEPESFGLTARDISSASDKDLNQFVGIKKLASYRDRSRMEADRKRYSKSKRSRKWREEVFGNEAPPNDEAWEKAKAAIEAEAQEQEPKKQKKHKSHKKHKKN